LVPMIIEAIHPMNAPAKIVIIKPILNDPLGMKRPLKSSTPL
jgi:hypothetical protein